MPDDQTQTDTSRETEDVRPSDTEAAHQPEEGGAVRDPRLQTQAGLEQTADQNHGSLDGHPPKDPRRDAQAGERLGDRGNRIGS
jgi:hypothetical protein